MKSTLIQKMRESHRDMTIGEASQAIDSVFAALRGALEDGAPYIVIPCFGTFRRKLRDTRQVRNPKTGETSTKVAHYVVTFKGAKAR